MYTYFFWRITASITEFRAQTIAKGILIIVGYSSSGMIEDILDHSINAPVSPTAPKYSRRDTPSSLLIYPRWSLYIMAAATVWPLVTVFVGVCRINSIISCCSAGAVRGKSSVYYNFVYCYFYWYSFFIF